MHAPVFDPAQPHSQQQQYHYLPVKDMLSAMMQDIELPYEIKVSANPLINRLRERFEANEQKKAMFDKMSAAIQEFLDSDKADFTNTSEELDHLFSIMFANAIRPDKMGMIIPPLAGRLLYASPAFKQGFLETALEAKFEVCDFDMEEKNRHRITKAGIMILNRCYGQNIDVMAQKAITVRDPHTDLERHFKMEVFTEGIEVIPVKTPRKLNELQIQTLLTHLEDTDLWLKYLPPTHFRFEGLTFIGLTDITAIETISQMKELMFENNVNPQPQEMLPKIRQKVQSFLGMADLEVGFLAIEMPGSDTIPPPMSLFSNRGLSVDAVVSQIPWYKKVFETGEPLFLDIRKQDTDIAASGWLREMGLDCLTLMPLKNPQQEVIGIVELATPESCRLNALHLVQLREVQSLMSFGLQRTKEGVSQQINLYVQKQFTAIHPSVEWRFQEVAARQFMWGFDESQPREIEPITFRHVFPLYGQADIVSSSTMRNRAIRADLLHNLELAAQLLRTAQKEVHFPLIDVFLAQAESFHRELSENFISSHESVIVDFLTKNLHPLLRQLESNFPDQMNGHIAAYRAELDTELDIIYRKRKSYEDSVGMLNQRISHLLEKSNAEMQKVMPHYFEYFKTDGVEYNLYVGDSISPKHDFSDFHLKNFRLWQLVNMCEITRLVDDLKTELPVPLKTAQLIFVYNNSLSISFHMDEKKFDVDGAYNVRYEIIKKRIDKAMVKGKNERLTLKGKIAIVYLQEKDRKEYLEYLDYLLQRGYITDEIEELELEKLQGVEGLQALRVTVAIPEEETDHPKIALTEKEKSIA